MEVKISMEIWCWQFVSLLEHTGIVLSNTWHSKNHQCSHQLHPWLQILSTSIYLSALPSIQLLNYHWAKSFPNMSVAIAEIDSQLRKFLTLSRAFSCILCFKVQFYSWRCETYVVFLLWSKWCKSIFAYFRFHLPCAILFHHVYLIPQIISAPKWCRKFHLYFCFQTIVNVRRFSLANNGRSWDNWLKWFRWSHFIDCRYRTILSSWRRCKNYK